MKITEAYAGLVARDAYFWAWPMVNIYNRRLIFSKIPEILMAGPITASPPNYLGMLIDYVAPDQRVVACPNQDVVYGGSSLALDKSPVVVQVPDFGGRFWVYQVVDLRSDAFAQLGKPYGTEPGFYLLAGPGWNQEIPAGIRRVFHASTDTGFIIPRVFQDDSKEDNAKVRDVTQGVTIYPLSEFDGKMRRHDWSTLKKVPAMSSGGGEQKWVIPEEFFDVLPAVLADAPPLPGEEARYEQVLAVLTAAKKDPGIRKAMVDAAVQADRELVSPLLEFRAWGLQLPHHWSTIDNGAAFGTDYFTRTAVARSNIFVNTQNETKYFYQDLDEAGARLNGANSYTVTFANGQVPPVRGFWSLTLYNDKHFFAPNSLGRYSLGTKNKGLKPNPDGSLTLYVQSTSPGKDREDNWLPSPQGEDFTLYVRAYWPEEPVLSGQWTPPPVSKSG